MLIRHILASNSQCYIKLYNGILTLDIIAISQFTKFLLTSCHSYIEVNRSSVGMEHKEMNFGTPGSYCIHFLKFTSVMLFHECSSSSTTITNQYKLELNLGFSLGSCCDVTSILTSLSCTFNIICLVFYRNSVKKFEGGK